MRYQLTMTNRITAHQHHVEAECKNKAAALAWASNAKQYLLGVYCDPAPKDFYLVRLFKNGTTDPDTGMAL